MISTYARSLMGASMPAKPSIVHGRPSPSPCAPTTREAVQSAAEAQAQTHERREEERAQSSSPSASSPSPTPARVLGATPRTLALAVLGGLLGLVAIARLSARTTRRRC